MDFITDHKFVRFFIWIGFPFLMLGLYMWLAYHGDAPQIATLTLALFLPIASFFFMLAFDFMSESRSSVAREVLAVIGILTAVIPAVIYHISMMVTLSENRGTGGNALTKTGWGLTILPAIAIGIFLMYIWLGFSNTSEFTVFALPIGFIAMIIVMIVLVVIFGMSLFTFSLVTIFASAILFAIMLILRLHNGTAFEAV